MPTYEYVLPPMRREIRAVHESGGIYERQDCLPQVSVRGHQAADERVYP